MEIKIKDNIVILDDNVQIDTTKIKIYKSKSKKYAWINNMLLHRFIIGDNREDKELVCDHINGNSLDNRRCNLRMCSILENAHNIKNTMRSNIGIHGLCVRINSEYRYVRASVTNRFENGSVHSDGRIAGKRVSKQFNINKLGYDEAIRLATEWLCEMRIKFDYKMEV